MPYFHVSVAPNCREWAARVLCVYNVRCKIKSLFFWLVTPWSVFFSCHRDCAGEFLGLSSVAWSISCLCLLPSFYLLGCFKTTDASPYSFVVKEGTLFTNVVKGCVWSIIVVFNFHGNGVITTMTNSDKEKDTAVLDSFLPCSVHGRLRCYASDYPWLKPHTQVTLHLTVGLSARID